MIEYYWHEFVLRLRRFWFVVRRRPLFRCPMCHGKGSAMSGHEYCEWDECRYCYELGGDFAEDHGMSWAIGRISLLPWLRAKILIALGYGGWSHCTVRRAVLCALGWHDWTDDLDDDVTLCRWCLEMKPETAEDAEG